MFPQDKLERLQDGDGHVEGSPVQDAQGNVVKYDYDIGEGQQCHVPDLLLETHFLKDTTSVTRHKGGIKKDGNFS